MPHTMFTQSPLGMLRESTSHHYLISAAPRSSSVYIAEQKASAAHCKADSSKEVGKGSDGWQRVEGEGEG